MPKYEYIRPTSHWKQKKRRSRLPKNIFLACLVLIATGALFSLAAFAWVSRDLPDPNALLKRDVEQSTKIYDRTGEHLLYEIHGNKNRTLVTIENIPEIVKQATISIEDQQFYKHKGFNPYRVVVGLVWGMITKGRPQGGSTITQQLVKNAILSNERSVTRKIKELILSLAIEQRLTKDQILQLYLNEIPYGSTNYGVEAAAQAYFGKHVQDLDLAEAATLAALPKAPSTYLNNPDKLDARRDLVLRLMFDEGYITEEQKNTAQSEDVALVQKAENGITAPHFVFYVKQLLTEQYDFDEREVEEGGLKVITTLDYDKQLIAEAAIKNGVDTYGPSFNFNNGSLVALDPKTGQILSMVGSYDYFKDEIDGAVNVSLRARQPGSSFKPVVYTAAFIEGYTPNTILYDVNTTFKTEVSDYTPHNYDLGEHGPVTMRKALQGSLNIPAVKALSLVGVQKVLDFAESLGYTTFSDRSRFGLAVVLGGGEVKLLEHTAAFGTFATGGVRYPTSAILKVEDASGNVVNEWKAEPGKQVIDQNIAAETSNVLSDNAARTYIFGAGNHLTLPDRAVAAKTGTTNDYHDAWTIGYTPSLVAGVWVGNNNNDAMVRGADGSKIAAPIWQEFMSKALFGTPAEAFTAPVIPITGKDLLDGKFPTSTVTIDKNTGKLATNRTPDSSKETISCGEYHSELYYVNPADPLGAAPGAQPDNAQYTSWEAGLASWVERLKTTDPTKLPFQECVLPTEEDDVHTRANQPSISIQEPGRNDTIRGRSIQVEIRASARRGISRVEYAIDDRFVKESSSDSGTTINLPSWVDTGKHTLTATAYDDVDNSDAASVSIEVATEPATDSAEIIDPINGQTVGETNATYRVIVELREPNAVKQLSLFAESRADGQSQTIGSIDNPSQIFTSFSWTLPSAGEYVLSVQSEDQNGNRADAPQILVVVKETDPDTSALNLIDQEPSDADAVVLETPTL